MVYTNTWGGMYIYMDGIYIYVQGGIHGYTVLHVQVNVQGEDPQWRKG